MAQKALAAVKNVLAKLPKIKAPWEVTGIASGAEYRDYLPLPTQYRVHSPGYVNSVQWVMTGLCWALK